MNSLLPQVIILGLAASVSPVAVMLLISILSKPHPGRNSLPFLLGYPIGYGRQASTGSPVQARNTTYRN